MNKFLIVIATYNAKRFISRCLDSMKQDHPNYEVVVIDDCSTDGTWDMILKYLYHAEYNYTHIGSALANQKKVINKYSFNPDDIIVIVDGDDYLYDSYVLHYLDSIYTPDVWFTYGQNISLSGKLDRVSYPLNAIKTWYKGPIEIISLRSDEYRQYGLWHTSHLITFRKGLFDLIRDEDLRGEDGEYFRTCCDVAKVYPMIEMAGDKHIKYIDKVLYVYNDIDNNYNNDMRVEENMKNMNYIQGLLQYEEITDYRG